MRLVPSLFVAAFVTTGLVVACGGSTTSDSCSAGTFCVQDGGPTPSDAGDAGGDGGCTKADVPGRRACVPGIATPDAALTLGVDASDGCLGCFTTLACKVQVSGTTITVTMEATTCPPPGDHACPAICQIPSTTCTIPPLAAGTYDVAVTGEGARGGAAPRKLVVEKDATSATSCALPSPGTPVPTLDVDPATQSCTTDADCVLETAGNLCQPCRCPNVAVDKASSTAFEAKARAIGSFCEADRSGIACAACAPTKAACDKTSGPGKCVVVAASP